MTHVAPQGSGLDLGDVVQKYGSKAAVACIEVANGISANTQVRKEHEVRAAKAFLRWHLPKEVPIIGGFAFLKNYNARDRPLGDGIDFSIHVSGYDSTRYQRSVESVATYRPCEEQPNRWTLPNAEERELVQDVLAISEHHGVPLHHFFDIHRSGFWRKLRPFLSTSTTAHKYIEGIKKPRGQIMEQYVGRTLRHHLPEGDVLLNYAFPIAANGRRIDVDNLVIAPSLDALADMLACLASDEKADIHLADPPYITQWKAA